MSPSTQGTINHGYAIRPCTWNISWQKCDLIYSMAFCRHPPSQAEEPPPCNTEWPIYLNALGTHKFRAPKKNPHPIGPLGSRSIVGFPVADWHYLFRPRREAVTLYNANVIQLSYIRGPGAVVPSPQLPRLSQSPCFPGLVNK